MCGGRWRLCQGATGARGNRWNGSLGFGRAKSARFSLSSPFFANALPRFSPEAKLLCHFTPLRRISRSNHRVVTRQSPFLAVFIRRHPVGGAQMSLQKLEFSSVLQANEIIGLDRLLDRYGGGWRLMIWLRTGEATQRSMHRDNYLRDNFRRNAAVANERGNNLSGQFHEFSRTGISHGSPGRLFRATCPDYRKHGGRIDGQQ